VLSEKIFFLNVQATSFNFMADFIWASQNAWPSNFYTSKPRASLRIVDRVSGGSNIEST